MLHALRGLTARAELSEERAADARTDFAELAPYDATFVALAEALDVPLVTRDARLAGAPSHSAEIELFDRA